MCEKLTVFFYPKNQKKEVNHGPVKIYAQNCLQAPAE